MKEGFRLENFACRNLGDVNLTLAPGQCMGLSGPSGIGKTLFLRALADLDSYQGRMLLDGVAADQIPAPQWRRMVGLLPAESAWWFDTVGRHFPEAPLEWLPRLGFEPEVLQWEVARLSSGERQRLSLLRLLVNHPRVLLLDEPTANLDAANIGRVEELLRAYRRDHRPVMIWVGHDLEQLQRLCNPIMLMADGGLRPLPAGGVDGSAAANPEEKWTSSSSHPLT